ALDLSRPEGRTVLLKLLEKADVLIENFKTGTMEKWGVGYGTLSEKYPTLVHARISGFGADGPLGGFPGYDAMVQASAGLVSVNDGQFRKLCQMLGKPEMADDPRFKTNKDRLAHKTEMEAELRALTKDRDGESFANELMMAGVPSGAVQEVPDVMEHPHTRHRNTAWEEDGYRNAGNPVKPSRTPPAIRSKPRKCG